MIYLENLNFNNNKNIISFKVKRNHDKLENYLKEEYKISSRMIKRMVRDKSIYLNQENVKRNVKVKKGDIIYLFMKDEEENSLPDPNVKINIVYEDDDILVINKDPFTVVHTTKKHQMGTIANGICDYFLRKNINKKVRFINRLDRDTSGILLIGKNSFAHQQISEQFKRDEVVKKYLAIVNGVVKEHKGTIDEPIERESEDSIIRIVREDGKSSLTHYEVVERYKNASLLRVSLETGRTHQIRVHLKYIGHPIIGDELYFEKSNNIKRQALHSYYMEISQPRFKKKLKLEAELPEDMKKLIEVLKNS